MSINNKIVTPISPSDLKFNIPDEVIDCVNKLLQKKYVGKNDITIYREELIEDIIKSMPDMTREIIFDRHYLDFEPMYRDNGWKVRYESPDRGETFKEYFDFTF